MRKILSLVTVVSCLVSLSAAQSLPPSPCNTPSFKGAKSLNVGALINGGELTAVALTDLNKDGLPDVVTANAQSSTVAVLLGGAQGFAAPVSYSVGGARPFSLAVSDFNRDGKMDVVTANPTSSNLSVMLGDGAGGFSTATLLNVSADPIDVTVGDFNGDGKDDVAAACSNAGTVRVSLGDGAGGFGAFSAFTVGTRPRALVVADFNLDGKSDLAVANTWSDNVSILIGDGVGGFAAQTQFNTASSPQHLAVADFNGDGRADLASANGASPGVSVLFGAGDGQFAAPLNLSVGAAATSLIAGDFNNDGSPDIATGTNSSDIAISLGDGAGGFGIAKRFGVAFGGLYLASGDYNLDGSEDIIAAGYQAGAIIPLAGDGAGNFAVTPRLTATTNGSSTALADFNGDSRLDVVYATDNADTVSVRLGDGAGSFGNPTNFNAGTRPLGVNVGDFNNDGRADIIAASTSLTSLAVLLGDGAGGFTQPSFTTVPQIKPGFIAVGDLNKDNKADVVVVRVDNNFAVTVLLGNGAGGFGTPVNYPTAPLPRTIAIGDFNGDTKPDLAVSDNTFSILLGDGAGGFAAPMNTNFGENTGPSAIVSGDFSGDGKLDLAISNEFTHNVSVLIGNGAGQFAPRVNYKVGAAPVSLAVADFNGDGKLDLAAGNRSSDSVSILLGDGAGVFGQPFNWAVPSNPNSVAVGDLDGDGRTDIIAAGFGFLASLVNTCGQASTPPSALLSINDVTVAEPDSGTTNAVFTVSLAAASAAPVTTKFVTRAANAERGRDFQAVSGTLTFAPGVTTQTVSIPVNGDTIDEFDEVFTLNLFEPTGALIADRQGSATITDNDAPPSLSAGNVSAFEQHTNNTFSLPVSLSQPSGKLVSVAYSTADGTATAGADYVSSSGTLSIPAGASSNNINVQVVGDNVNEPDETFFVNLSNPSNASVAVSQGVLTIVNDDASSVQFSAAAYAANEGGTVDVSVTRTGNTSREGFVNYATSNGTANARQDYTAAVGRLRFGPGETSKSFRVLTTDDRFNDDGESFVVTLSDPVDAGLGAQTTATININDNDTADGPSPVGDASFDVDFFVRQHYADFLNREPDASGLQFWTNEITQCGADAQCRAVKRINVSAAFFLSIEFQETGYLAYRTYKTAYGDTTSPNVAGTVPVIRLNEFLPDTQMLGQGVVVGQGAWQTQLENNKVAYVLEFVGRQRFTDAFPVTLSAAQFVDKLALNAGVTLSQSERDQLLSTLGSTPADTTKRAQVLRAVAEHPQLRQNEFNHAFVLMQFYGYMRRNPDDPQDTDFRGWKFWLDKLNQFGGNYVGAEMVKAFITSDEYRRRFGQ